MLLARTTTWLDLLTSVFNAMHNSLQSMAQFLASGIIVYIILSTFLTGANISFGLVDRDMNTWRELEFRWCPIICSY